jgi:hypothetical protein
MNALPEMSAEEVELLVELLEREERDLPSEIHHTRLTNYRNALHERLELVRGLLEHLRAPSTA